MSIQYQLTDVMQKAVFYPWSALLEYGQRLVTHPDYPLRGTWFGRLQAASFESTSRLLGHYPKQGYGIDAGEADGRSIPVLEQTVLKKPFCHLLHFATDGAPGRPKVLIIAALSGHHATLSRETYSAFVPDHDVYVTDWQDARYVPLSEGRFGFEDYVRYVIEFLAHLGPETHVVAICQAAAPVLTAVAVMAARQHRQRPKSLTLMAGPIDVRANPNMLTRVSKLSNARLHRLLTVKKVPVGYPGVGRRVYPGIVQLAAFMSMNLRTHGQKHWQFFVDVLNGDVQAAAKHREFYNEYFAVLDMTEEFFIETLERVFFDQQLSKGTMQYEGATVDCAAITDVPLFTIEGAEDDMCKVGMTAAAHALCPALAPELHRQYVQPGVGHYGVFSGSRYREEVAPQIKAFIAGYT